MTAGDAHKLPAGGALAVAAIIFRTRDLVLAEHLCPVSAAMCGTATPDWTRLSATGPLNSRRLRPRSHN